MAIKRRICIIGLVLVIISGALPSDGIELGSNTCNGSTGVQLHKRTLTEGGGGGGGGGEGSWLLESKISSNCQNPNGISYCALGKDKPAGKSNPGQPYTGRGCLKIYGCPS